MLEWAFVFSTMKGTVLYRYSIPVPTQRWSLKGNTHYLQVFDFLTQTVQSPCGTIQRQFCKAPNGPSVQELQHGLNIPEVSTAAQHQGNAYGHVSAYRWSRARLLLVPTSHCSCFYLLPAHLIWCIASVLLLLKENRIPPDTAAPGNYRTLPSYNSQKHLTEDLFPCPAMVCVLRSQSIIESQ